MIDRRALLVGTGAVLLGSPLAGGAQRPAKVYRIGFMIGSSLSTSAHLVDAFRQSTLTISLRKPAAP